MGKVIRHFCWHQNFVPGGCLPLPRGYIHVLNHEKNCIKSDFKDIFLNLQQMNEVTRHFCWHQNFVPWGLSVPTLGLYTCIKSWKKMYKIRLQRDSFETCNKWPKWQDVPVDIKISSPRGCQPLRWGYIHVKSWKKLYKIRLKRDFFKTCSKWPKWQEVLLTSKFCPLGLSAPDLWLYTFIKSWKDVYKVRGWRDSFCLPPSGGKQLDWDSDTF